MANEKMSRNTKQRQIILEELKKLTSHPTASAMYDIVRQKLPKISLGTVYRNLDLLSKSGKIQKLVACGKEARFDGNPHNHYHVRCVNCGRVDDICDIGDSIINDKAFSLKNYTILGHRLEFFGLCSECVDQGHSTESDMTH